MTFDEWWHEIGSGIYPLPNDDYETHARRVALAAWYDSKEADNE